MVVDGPLRGQHAGHPGLLVGGTGQAVQGEIKVGRVPKCLVNSFSNL